jgi:hypothetical protein
MSKFDELYESTLNEGPRVAATYTTVMKGGSIGEKSVSDLAQLRGDKADKSKSYFEEYEDYADAQAEAKRKNKRLSPGEKKYYGIRYVVAGIDADGNYTGKGK